MRRSRQGTGAKRHVAEHTFSWRDMLASHLVDEVGSMFVGSSCLGGALGLAGAYLSRRVLFLRLGERREQVPHMELALILTVALFTYTAAERLRLSGIMALFTCGAATRHYTYHNLSREAQDSSMSLFMTAASLAETALSTLLGVALFDYLLWSLGALAWDGPPFDVTFAVTTLPILLLTRALNIFPLSALSNWCRPSEKRISLPMQSVMWFSCMRGALSFALVLALTFHHLSSPATTFQHLLPGALSFALAVTLNDPRAPVSRNIFHQVVAATLLTIAVTTLLMAPATSPLIRSLQLGSVGPAALADALLHPKTLDYESPR